MNQNALLSYWEKDCLRSQDVLIVGGGFTGILTAIFLKQSSPRLRITILEKGTFTLGASSRNAGFVCFGSPSEIASQIESLGQEKILKLTQQRMLGLDILSNLLGSEGKRAVMWEDNGGYEIFFDKEDGNRSTAIANQFMKENFGFNDLYKIIPTGPTSFGFSNKVQSVFFNSKEAQVHSGRLLLYLQRMAQQRGVQVLHGVALTGFDADSISLKISNPESFLTIKRKTLILCTNAFLPDFVKGTDLKPGRGQVVVTKPILDQTGASDLKIKGCFHCNKGYIYFRNVDDSRLLIGGFRDEHREQEESFSLETTENVYESIRAFTEKTFGKDLLAKENIDCHWSGIMAFNALSTPYVGEVEKNVFAIGGMQGMGLALAPYLAKTFCEDLF